MKTEDVNKEIAQSQLLKEIRQRVEAAEANQSK